MLIIRNIVIITAINHYPQENGDLFEAPLCERGALQVLHGPDLVCQLLTLKKNNI